MQEKIINNNHILVYIIQETSTFSFLVNYLLPIKDLNLIFLKLYNHSFKEMHFLPLRLSACLHEENFQ